MSAILRNLNNVPALFSAGLEQEDRASRAVSLADRVFAGPYGITPRLSPSALPVATLLVLLLVFGKPWLAAGAAALN